MPVSLMGFCIAIVYGYLIIKLASPAKMVAGHQSSLATVSARCASTVAAQNGMGHIALILQTALDCFAYALNDDCDSAWLIVGDNIVSATNHS